MPRPVWQLAVTTACFSFDHTDLYFPSSSYSIDGSLLCIRASMTGIMLRVLVSGPSSSGLLSPSQFE
jgi:hypothetical protein